MKARFIVLIIVILFVVGGIFFIVNPFKRSPTQIAPAEVHEHADFKVYLNGQAVNFSQNKYMSTDTKPLAESIHLHDMDGFVIHKHANGVTLGDFFNSLGMKFNASCFVLDNGTAYCNQGQKTLKMYVNGKVNSKYNKYEFKDLDRILITYGNDNQDQIRQQISSVTNNACIYSKKCPERGIAPDESSCTTGGICKVNGI